MSFDRSSLWTINLTDTHVERTNFGVFFTLGRWCGLCYVHLLRSGDGVRATGSPVRTAQVGQIRRSRRRRRRRAF